MALSRFDTAIEDALVRRTQRELFHRTTPVLLGFLRFLVSVNFFRRQFHHKFVMFFQPDTDPCLTTDAIDTSLFSHEAALFHHVIEGVPLGWIFALFFAPLPVDIPDGLDGNFFGGIHDAHFLEEVVEKIIVCEQGSGGSLDRLGNL